MPCCPGKRGISRKITGIKDRKRISDIMDDMQIPSPISVIIRTAGVNSDAEGIMDDYCYLIRLWNLILKTAVSAKAGSLISAEDDVIKRTIRDVCGKGIDEIIVEGTSAYKVANSFIKLAFKSIKIPLKLYSSKIPIFHRYGIEEKIYKLYNNKVLLESGGSIVLDQTEAMVVIDVNSGKSTTEHGIERTALCTNLEASLEIARQLRLRDLAGLVIIDYIDMIETANKRMVERSLKDALKNDKAKIQMAHISALGVLEMSRQRMGASLAERVSEICPHCRGLGAIKSREIVANSIIRSCRNVAVDKYLGYIYVYTTSAIVSYMLNYKRDKILKLEYNYNTRLFINCDEKIADNGFYIKRKKVLTDFEKMALEITNNEQTTTNALIDDSMYYSCHGNVLEQDSNFKQQSNNKRTVKKKYSYTKNRNNVNRSLMQSITSKFAFWKKI